MPQLDTVTFLSQLFWLVIIFGAFYLTVLTDILPSFSRVLKSRLKKLKSNKDAMYSLGDEKVKPHLYMIAHYQQDLTDHVQTY